MGSRLDYCNSLLAGTSVLNLSRLQLVQNTLARVVAQKPRFCRISHRFWSIDLHWLPVRQRIEFGMATTAFEVLRYQQPSYLAEILPRYTPSRSLRSSASTTMSVPLRKTSMVFSKSFSSVASNIWNKLPGHLSYPSQLSSAFRKHLKYTTFFSRPTMALITQPPRLFSPVTSCRPHSAFQPGAVTPYTRGWSIPHAKIGGVEKKSLQHFCRQEINKPTQTLFFTHYFTILAKLRWRVKRSV